MKEKYLSDSRSDSTYQSSCGDEYYNGRNSTVVARDSSVEVLWRNRLAE